MTRRQISVMPGKEPERVRYNPVRALEEAVAALRREETPAAVLQLLAHTARNVTGAQLCATLMRAEAGRGQHAAALGQHHGRRVEVDERRAERVAHEAHAR